MRNMEGELEDSILLLEANVQRTAIQLEFVKQVASSMSPEHCRLHLEVLKVLSSKLDLARNKVESIVTASKSSLKKLTYIWARDAINEAIEDLELWQRTFDPTWYLILRIGDKIIDTQLADQPVLPCIPPAQPTLISRLSDATTLVPSAQSLRNEITGARDTHIHVSLSESGLDWAKAEAIPHSTSQIIQRLSTKPRTFIVDRMACTPDIDIANLRTDAENLSRKLANIEPQTFGLPICHGIVKRRHRETKRLESINMVFQMPTTTCRPESLRNYLYQNPDCSLTVRLDIAQQLASAISFVHTCDFVHKNVRPETILIFSDRERPHVSAFLLGFDSFRSVSFQTLRKGDVAWERNLYRHPSRQGSLAHDRYVMQHDVYSLGVCLLELGLWESFAIFDAQENALNPSQALSLSRKDFDKPQEDARQPSSHIKDHLVDMAKRRLPMRMGDKYTAVVVTCLTCLDEGNDDFGASQEMEDENGVLVGVRFIEKVLIKLGILSC